MSNISGNTFFIENSVNCSDLGTLNGQVTFIDCSINCGQVLNAIFSGSCVRNDGQACGCTIFCNSYSYGYVCGTGILRGNSVLIGGADCIIQCDQSVIDGGSSVTDYEFLVTTPRPESLYSDDGCYYIYSSGVSTLGNGAWSNCYFCNGSPCEFVTSVCDVQIKLAANVQDATGDWRTYSLNGNNYLIQAADGDYFNLSVCNCILYTGTSCYPVCVNDTSSQSFYTMYVSGSGCNILSGIYDVGDSRISKFDHSLSNVGIAAYGMTPELFLIQNSNLIFNENRYIYITNSTTHEHVIVSNPSALLLNSCNPFCAVDDCFFILNAAVASAYRIECQFSCTLPLQAIDNAAYYIYSSGIVTIATGLYSNYAINGGVIDCGYSTNMPTGAIDGGCYIYESGVAINLGDVNNYILDNNLYYGEHQYYAYENFCFFPFKSDNTKIGLVVFSEGIQCLNCCIKNSHSFTCQQAGGFSDGCRAFYAEFSNIDSCWGIACVNTNFSCSLPFITEEACFPGSPVIKYYIYCSGIGSLATGAFTNCWFENSCATTCTILTPVEAQDNLGYYYIYNSGVPSLAPQGAYSNYYFNEFSSIATTCCIATPAITQDNCFYRIYCDGIAIVPQGSSYSNYYICYVDGSIDPQDRPTPSEAGDNIGYYYIYCTGIAILAPPGTYSNFVIDGNGQKLSSCSTNYATCAIDNGLFYTYFEGGSNGLAAGLYSDHYYTDGCVDTIYTCTLAQVTQDNCCYYVYDTGLAIEATGAYSNYYFDPATSIATTCSIATPTAAQDNCIFYTYCDGSAAIVTGCRNDAPGYDAYPTGTYNFGDNGENNPVPCFYLFKNGPYTYTYYCADVPNSACGITNFGSLVTVCAGDPNGCGDVQRCVWLYHNTLSCCGIDPVSLGFCCDGSFTCYANLCTSQDSSTSQYCCSSWCATVLTNSCCLYNFYAINDKYYSNLTSQTTLQGDVVLQNCNCFAWACQDLYCNLYCTCTYDVYNTEDPPVCIGQDTCQVCCGQECYGSEVCTCYEAYRYLAITFDAGYLVCLKECISCYSFGNVIYCNDIQCDAAYVNAWASGRTCNDIDGNFNFLYL
jgi:hypothetical protein